MRITAVRSLDLRFPLPPGAGSDAIHSNPVYSLATCALDTDAEVSGTGFSLTLGAGNDLVCGAIRQYAKYLVGADVDEVMESLGERWHAWANDGQLRWLGPQKGVVHLALAAVVGALVDVWARARQAPLWRALLDLTPEEVVALVDFSTVDDFISREEAIELLRQRRLSAAEADELLVHGYPAYDTSVGWFGYDTRTLVANVARARDAGYGAVKLKVGSPNIDVDVERVGAVREALGHDFLVMIDANQRWSAQEAIRAGQLLARFEPFWFEEPVHPDDIAGYLAVREALSPMRVAGGEHIPNQVVFKNFLASGALDIAQPDVVRLGGLPEYLAVALMAAKRSVPVLPHAGDMGQVHQHLTFFTRIALGLPELPLEMIPHLAEHFTEPCEIVGGRYLAPMAPGASTTIRHESVRRFAVPGTDVQGLRDAD